MENCCSGGVALGMTEAPGVVEEGCGAWVGCSAVGGLVVAGLGTVVG